MKLFVLDFIDLIFSLDFVKKLYLWNATVGWGFF